MNMETPARRLPTKSPPVPATIMVPGGGNMMVGASDHDAKINISATIPGDAMPAMSGAALATT